MKINTFAFALACGALVGCAGSTQQNDDQLRAKALETMRASFKARVLLVNGFPRPFS